MLHSTGDWFSSTASFSNACLTQLSAKFTADQAISTLHRVVILDAVKVNVFPAVIAIYLNKTNVLAVLPKNVC